MRSAVSVRSAPSLRYRQQNRLKDKQQTNSPKIHNSYFVCVSLQQQHQQYQPTTDESKMFSRIIFAIFSIVSFSFLSPTSLVSLSQILLFLISPHPRHGAASGRRTFAGPRHCPVRRQSDVQRGLTRPSPSVPPSRALVAAAREQRVRPNTSVPARKKTNGAVLPSPPPLFSFRTRRSSGGIRPGVRTFTRRREPSKA